MNAQHTRFEDTCEIVGVKNGIGVTGEILTFKEHEVIIATINRSVKVKLDWNKHAEFYVGSVGGVEFQSVGPKAYTYRTTR